MYIILMLIVSAIILYIGLFHSYKLERRRENSCCCWRNYLWIEVGKARPKLWVVTLSIIAVLIPLVNIFISIIVLLIYLTQGMRENESDDGIDLVEYKTVIRYKPLTKLIEFLNKEL